MKKFWGIFFIILGVVSGFLPFMPGFVFIIMGLSMLSPRIALKIKHLHRRYKCHQDFKKLCRESMEETRSTIREKWSRSPQ